MKKLNVVRSLLVGAAIPSLLMVTSGSASADGYGITWRNGKTGNYLTAYYNGKVGDDAHYQGESDWNDIENSDGTWNEVNVHLGQCLTGYYAQVYTENCNSGTNGTNSWERWYEWPTSTGWELKNVETGYILDDDGYDNVYANSTDWANSNQRWH
ncbi:hypothetical protein OG762_31030 [Streptomyces sp. NBC_01136]|uniref:hypothetical protein n=1 Tax=unclassified Streptomyces TaxID=2593676 RepID=UPI0032433E24|nr:hypothetical protein OG762_31030 [Streptomyces sp. NBC_01136]